MSIPKRIQRKRTKGWRMPAGAIYVGRPTKFGNPFMRCDRFLNVALFRDWLSGRGRSKWRSLWDERGRLLSSLHELRGKDLACWCALDVPCHADVLLDLANR